MKLRRQLRTPRHGFFLVLFILGLVIPWNATAQITVQGELTHELELLPGTTHEASIVLHNGGTTPSEVKVYQTDYRSELPNHHFYEDAGTNPRSNAGWVTISPMRFTVPAGETYAVSYVIDVPTDPSLDGTYWSVLMIEPIPPESPESSEADPSDPTIGVITVIRYAFGLITHIGTSGTVQPEIEDVSLTLAGGVPMLGVDIKNTGSRLIRIEIWAELYDSDGNFVARRDGAAGNLYPASARQFRVPLDEIEVGSYTSLVVIDAGDNNVFGASLPLVLE